MLWCVRVGRSRFSSLGTARGAAGRSPLRMGLPPSTGQPQPPVGPGQLRKGFLIAPISKAAVPRSQRPCLGKPGSAQHQERPHGRTSPARNRTEHSPGRVCSLARGFPWCWWSGGELCFLLGERRAWGSCSMNHSCAEPGRLSSRMSSATVSLRSPFLLLGEHEVDGEDPQASAGTRDSYNCNFPTALVRGTLRVPWGITPVSSMVPTEVAAAVVPVVWASGILRKWTRAEPLRFTPKPESILCPSVPAWLFVALQAEEPRPEMAQCCCDPQWVSPALGTVPRAPFGIPC
ncbi:uncharacterized protein LOC113974898 [Neopelma chrysocephalum]|uniref:uncharacterized protein LOC113974898 n=1 Tax=Neopelma chrysocephalum TaxID=114329 RepID=UPI000FCD1B90|nr:uncharacterized protein LOC113974898 [Neopelma chrysocephalum]